MRAKIIECRSTREGFGQALIKIAKADRNVVAMDCDLGRSTHSYDITQVDPDRFIEMGISEQDMISTAAGMSRLGKIVFTNSFAVFITGRAFDQIRQQIALPKSNVKICGSSAGITQGPDGATHQSVIDVALMRSLPNMTVLVPADAEQTKTMVYAAHSYEGPVYIRLSRYETGNFIPFGIEYEIGKAQILRRGRMIVLASYGPIMRNVICASDILLKNDISVGIVNFHTIKPLDDFAIRQLSNEYAHIVSIEEHSIYGGLGSAIAESLAEFKNIKDRATLHRLGIRDTFGESGTADDLLKKHKLDPQGIVESIIEIANS